MHPLIAISWDFQLFSKQYLMCGEMLAEVFGDIVASFHNIGSNIGKDGYKVIFDILHALSVKLDVSFGGFHKDLIVFFLSVPEFLLVLNKLKCTL
jgi:hypothetical protein